MEPSTPDHRVMVFNSSRSQDFRQSPPTKPKVVAWIGDVVLAPGNIRGIVIAVELSHGCRMPLGNP
jgi:hypothetical protein